MAAVNLSTSKGGFARLNEYALVEVTGADSAKYLQARLTSDVTKLSDGQGQMSSLLDRKAYIIAYFSLHRVSSDRFIFMMEREQVPTVLEQIEKYHFQEKLSYKALDDWKIWTVMGPMTALFEVPECGLKLDRSFSPDASFCIASTDLSVEEKIHAAFEPIDEQELEVARIEAGIPRWGIDFGSAEVLPETGLENIAASYSKGCFQGQEVLARIRTYGAPKRGLVGLVFDGDASPIDGIDLRSKCFSSTLQKNIALAYVPRELRVPGTKVGNATVVDLPFVEPKMRRAEAKKLFDAALHEFTVGSEEEAIEQLREVIKLDPLLADGYEALGVALSKQDQLDEAIAIMKQLERLDPDSIMAHANLSVFYMQKGDKEAAEEEKAKAMSIRMSQMAKEFSQQQAKEEEIRKRKAEAEQRMAMFKQVLAIDAEDFLANAGMGSALVDSEKHDEALPYLEKALAVRPTHTVAYVSLAEAYERLGRIQDAIETYKRGVAIAAQRGDMTPMKDMQSRLDGLLAQSAS